jgi:hypothetical protein
MELKILLDKAVTVASESFKACFANVSIVSFCGSTASRRSCRSWVLGSRGWKLSLLLLLGLQRVTNACKTSRPARLVISRGGKEQSGVREHTVWV